MHVAHKWMRKAMKNAEQETYVHPDFEVTAMQSHSEDTAVAMYSDHNAEAKKKPVNDRATTLARRATGVLTKLIYGDAFVGRAFDDKNPSHW